MDEEVIATIILLDEPETFLIVEEPQQSADETRFHREHTVFTAC